MSQDWLADIGGAALFSVLSFDDMLSQYEIMTGQRATGIVYPAWSGAGPNWGSRLFPRSLLDDADSEASLVTVARNCQERELPLILELSLEMGFAATSANHILDPQASASTQCCINAPGTRRAVILLLREALNVLEAAGLNAPSGIVLTIQDLWPMGATGRYIEPTCFCPHCAKSFREHGFNRLDDFKVYPGPLNLALSDTGTGISHMHSFHQKVDKETLVQYSRAQGFIAADMIKDVEPWQSVTESNEWPRLQVWASTLLSYIETKQAITFQSLTQLSNEIRVVLPNAPVAVIVEPLDYDWTAGFYFAALQDQSFYDELWTSPGWTNSGGPPKVDRIYACGRTRYIVQSFFATIERAWAKNRAATPAGNSRIFEAHLRHVARQLDAAILDAPLSFELVGDLASSGVVAPVLSSTVIAQLVGLSVTGQEDAGQDDLRRMQELMEMLERSGGER